MRFIVVTVVVVGALICIGLVVIQWLWGGVFISLRDEQARAIRRIENLGGVASPLLGGDRYPESVGVFRNCGVDLRGTNICDDDLQILNDLHAEVGLVIADTSVTDEGMKVLAGLKRSTVWCLDASRTRISDHGLATIAQSPDLTKSLSDKRCQAAFR